MTQPDPIRKYPLLCKALGEQGALLRALGAELPEEVMSVQLRAFRVIDSLAPQSAAQKEAVMIVVVLANSPPTLYDDCLRFLREYSPAVHAAVTQLRDATYHAPLTPPLAQAKTALGIAMMQETRAQLESGAKTLSAQQARQIRDRVTAQAPREEARTFAQLDVPAMRAAFDAEKRALLDIIDDLAAAPFLDTRSPFGPRRP